MADTGPLDGRERQLAVLRGRIRDGVRLVTLTGPPGAAKTRLIREALRYEDVGARWEPASALGPRHLPDLAGRLREGLEDPAAPPLLVLDGWERLGRGGRTLVAGLLREVPAAAPRLTVLVTALRPLYLEGETTVVVGPESLRPAPAPPGPTGDGPARLHDAAPGPEQPRPGVRSGDGSRPLRAAGFGLEQPWPGVGPGDGPPSVPGRSLPSAVRPGDGPSPLRLAPPGDGARPAERPGDGPRPLRLPPAAGDQSVGDPPAGTPAGPFAGTPAGPPAGPPARPPAGDSSAGGLPHGELPLGALPAGGLPHGELPLGALPAGGLPHGELPVAGLPVAGLPRVETSPLQLAAAEHGYARCDPLERLLWERLSVFEGSFGREAVLEVCASGALPADVVLDVLERLAPLALLPADDGGSGEARHWMPHPMRVVGARRLAARGDRWAVVLHHRRWYVKVARRAADWWHGGRQIDARALALLELPDLAAAMDPTTAPLSPAAEADAAVEIAVLLWFLWVACGHVTEGRARLRHALALRPGPAPARALWLAAYLELESGRPQDADPLLVQAWAAAVREGDDRCLGMLAHLRGATALYQGRPEAAAAEFRDALGVLGEYPDLGPTRQLCWTALVLALVRTDPEAAQEALDRAAVRSWAGRDVWADAWAHYARAELLYWEGETTRAADLAARALRGHLRLGAVSGAACAAELLAQMRILRGRPRTAAHLLGAVDLLRADAFDDGYRPAEFCAPGRARSETALRDRLSDAELRRAYEEGARRGLYALVTES
ncbi:hypothetical protein ACGF1Z_20855 [Streptomyces sp. NPDC048018]|uniref:hypothetical protein n=1 Tax=Streptomyces sp. NPDC048018 TaxID=3365499 RepID=UPI003722B9CE